MITEFPRPESFAHFRAFKPNPDALIREKVEADYIAVTQNPFYRNDPLGVADRDMRDCIHTGLSEDWQLAIACNAALQCATAALAACGYRAAREAHHHRTIHSLTCTIQADPPLIRQFDAFRKKRNIGSYEQVGLVSDKEAPEMIGLARTLRQEVERWPKRNHPNLLSE